MQTFHHGNIEDLTSLGILKIDTFKVSDIEILTIFTSRIGCCAPVGACLKTTARFFYHFKCSSLVSIFPTPTSPISINLIIIILFLHPSIAVFLNNTSLHLREKLTLRRTNDKSEARHDQHACGCVFSVLSCLTGKSSDMFNPYADRRRSPHSFRSQATHGAAHLVLYSKQKDHSQHTFFYFFFEVGYHDC